MPIWSGTSFLEIKQSATNDEIFWRGRKKIHAGADSNQKINFHPPKKLSVYIWIVFTGTLNFNIQAASNVSRNAFESISFFPAKNPFVFTRCVAKTVDVSFNSGDFEREYKILIHMHNSILTVCDFLQPITDVLPRQSNKKIECEFAFCALSIDSTARRFNFLIVSQTAKTSGDWTAL